MERALVARGRTGPAGYAARNSPRFRERLVRQAGLLLTSPLRLLVRLFDPALAIRMRYAFLRGLSRDRLEFLGDEYVTRRLVRRIRADALGDPDDAVLVSSMPDHVVTPLARRLGVARVLCNRLEFRDGRATGRLLHPVVTGRGDPRDLPEPRPVDLFPPPPRARAVVRYDSPLARGSFSVPDCLGGRTLLLIGATGFIGKVFLANLLRGLPGIARVFLLIRRRGTVDAARRFERLREESPVLRQLDPGLLEGKVEIVEGDAGRPGLGLDPTDRARLEREVDVVVNSGGITEFNPDLRPALAANVEAALHVADFVAGCRDAGLVHLSTCFVAGQRGGRVAETLVRDYNPAGRDDFDAEHERIYLRGLVTVEEERERNRRSLRAELARHGTERARYWGWPNTYTFTKSLAESLLERRAGTIRLAVVRPSIVETSTREPFRGWNEGINTSAPLSYLLGTPFRQLPSNARKRLDVIPVDSVTRGLVLICAAVAGKRNRTVYQLASSVSNPCDMRRSIELTCLAHRKHYREQKGLAPWWRTTCETVPVSKRRYHAMSAPRQKAIVRLLRRTLPFVRQPLRRFERSLDRVEKLIELYEPFILDNDHAFEADRVEVLSAELPESERAAFGYDASRIAWPEYWIDVHIPALRKWSYPLIEGRSIEA